MAITHFLTDINLNKNELKNSLYEKLEFAPSNPKIGQFYYNTENNTVYVWNGSKWIIDSVDTEETNEITLATVATSGSYNDLTETPSLSGYQTTSNLVTSVSSQSTDSQYPSAKLFYDTIGNIETLLSEI